MSMAGRTGNISILGVSQILAHTPELVLSGSKPAREIHQDGDLVATIAASLRSYDDAERYLPNQIYTGAADPLPFTSPNRPWWVAPRTPTDSEYGTLFSQDEFLLAMSQVDSVGLLSLAAGRGGTDSARPRQATLLSRLVLPSKNEHVQSENGELIIGATEPIGTMNWGYPNDEALAPGVLLENIATKASAALALAQLIDQESIDQESVDLVISSSEEAVGDRYQRGGGNMGKTVAECLGMTKASGFDVKNFCAGPISALAVAGSLIRSGVARRVAVVAGGSLPKLGMKFQGHLKNDMPILEDCLGGFAIILGAEAPRDRTPVLRLDSLGWHTVGAGGTNPAIFRQLMIEPIERVGLKALDIDVFGTELHNPELTEPQGSGDVPARNYRLMAAAAATSGHMERDDVDAFLSTRAVAGFAPTQGHLASAISLLPYIVSGIRQGTLQRAQLIAKGSLFLGKMSRLSDGASMIFEDGGCDVG